MYFLPNINHKEVTYFVHGGMVSFIILAGCRIRKFENSFSKRVAAGKGCYLPIGIGKWNFKKLLETLPFTFIKGT